MTVPTVVRLDWNSVPMGAIESFRDWYDPYLGRGVYMLVLATTDERYVGYYVGKSDDIGRRWREHLHQWFLAPHEGYAIAKCADDFLNDPVDVINHEAFKPELPDRKDTQRRILDQTWFVFAELRNTEPSPRLEDVEYLLQEGLKKHAGIKAKGWIGDAANRERPATELTVSNRFGRPFLNATLPSVICLDSDGCIREA